ncbi:hypothetical protein OV079_13115 [Nannocystis pusilla]|uniref:Cytochrome P460 domain-containing protein n=1 Tax=Nannocystis pusilla TaxID=889268 RepID=A0A9X3IXE8_9BACT|nr:hypothetical protein [Nannocystis pusilla]MCY1006479.1 hypothetical protein [Nannocystis pusilla]
MPSHRTPLALVFALLVPACGSDGDPGDDGSSSDDTTSTAATASTTEAASTADAPTTSSTTGDGGTTSDASTTSPASTTGDDDALPPTDSAEQLEAWLAAGVYESWPAESQIHASAGPHGGNVRTFVNPALAESLATGATHPQGAASVKELYGDGTDEIVGYAVMVKLAPDSAGGDGWYWYERLDTTVYADDIGVNLCTGCHGGGSDYVLTPWPLQ